jgi:hypothetical protein
MVIIGDCTRSCLCNMRLLAVTSIIRLINEGTKTKPTAADRICQDTKPQYTPREKQTEVFKLKLKKLSVQAQRILGSQMKDQMSKGISRIRI